jgi:hypothetical protein
MGVQMTSTSDEEGIVRTLRLPDRCARQPKIMLQVLPSEAGAHQGLDGRFAIASFAGSPDVVYLDNALVGQVVERAEDVSRVTLLYDILKAERWLRAPRSTW